MLLSDFRVAQPISPIQPIAKDDALVWANTCVKVKEKKFYIYGTQTGRHFILDMWRACNYLQQNLLHWIAATKLFYSTHLKNMNIYKNTSRYRTSKMIDVNNLYLTYYHLKNIFARDEFMQWINSMCEKHISSYLLAKLYFCRKSACALRTNIL